MLWQREVRRKRWDAQALFGPAASGQQREQEAHCAPRSALLRGPRRQTQNQAWPLPLARPAQTFVSSIGTAP